MNCAFLVQNLLSTGFAGQFPLHTLTGTESPSGTEAWRVATGRRAASTSPTNRWMVTTTNTQMILTLVCDRVRYANGGVIDRFHNLSGKQVVWECSNDNFTSTEIARDAVVPSVSMPGALDDALGVRTEEGAWVNRWPGRAAKYWRVRIPTMGVGLKPSIPYAVLGQWYQPGRPFDWPIGKDNADNVQELFETEGGWSGATRKTLRRAETMRLRMASMLEYEQMARYHLAFLFNAGLPTWVCVDTNEAQRTICVQRTPGERFGFQLARDWLDKPQATLSYREYQPI